MAEFKPKIIKVYNYSEEIKEVTEIDYTGYGYCGGRKGNKSNEVSKEDRERNLKRVKKNVRRLALANDLGQVHLTLTFKENMQNVDKADNLFKKFIFELRKRYPYLKYIATRELQKRGAIHYHVLLNQRVNLKVARKLWKHGFIWLVGHKNKLEAVMYVLKYITKDVAESVMVSKTGHTKKAYLSSQGLKKELKNCTMSFLINQPDQYVEYRDNLNFLITNLSVGWDIPFSIELPDGRTLEGRSVLRCIENNY